MARGFATLLIILTIAFLGSLYLETSLTAHYMLELYLLLIGLVLGLLMLVGVGWGRSWGWPLATILFSLLLLNSVVVYLGSRQDFLVFEIVAFVTLVGIIMSFLRSGHTEERLPANNPLASLPKMEFESNPRPAKKSVKKKSSKKRKKKKRSKKRK